MSALPLLFSSDADLVVEEGVDVGVALLLLRLLGRDLVVGAREVEVGEVVGSKLAGGEKRADAAPAAVDDVGLCMCDLVRRTGHAQCRHAAGAQQARAGSERDLDLGERLGLLELQTLWPFPEDIVREKCAEVKSVIVVELNMGQMLQSVKLVVDEPGKVFLANRIDGVFITPKDITNILRLIQGKGV